MNTYDEEKIRTKAATQAYRDNWDRIFGDGPEPHKDPDEIEVKVTVRPPDDACDVCGAPAGSWCNDGCSECPKPE